MKYLPSHIQKEYERLSSLHPDLEDFQYPYINVSDILRGYFILADYFTDESSPKEVEKMLIGLRSYDLLVSALCRQRAMYGGRAKHTEPLDICSTLFFGLCKNHAFIDGNKRISLLMLMYQLQLYNYYPTVSIHNFEKLVIAVAANDLPGKYYKHFKKALKSNDPFVKTISRALKGMVTKKNHACSGIVTRDLCKALENYSVECRIENAKIHFTRKVPAGWFSSKELKHAVVFGGMTRTIGPKTTREILKKLELYDQFPEYQSLLDGKETLYELIERFEVPLRRLKDE